MSNTYTSTPSQTQNPASQRPYTYDLSGATNTNQSDARSYYAPSTTSTKASFSSSLSSRLGSFAKLPLLSRTKYSNTNSTQSSSSKTSSQRSATPSDSTPTKQQKPRDPVKSVPSGKPPATNFADLAYRYGTPSVPSTGRL